jgi:hypothetical protein
MSHNGKVKGKLPSTQLIQLDGNADQWRLLSNSLVKELSVTGLIELPTKTKARVTISIKKVWSPEDVKRSCIVKTETDFGVNETEGLRRVTEFFSNFADNSAWIMMGTLDGENKIPIIIVYYEVFNIAIYAIKFENEDIRKFFPGGIPENIQHN